MTDPEIRLARPADADAAVRLLDAAMLEVDPDRVRKRIDDGCILVADAGARLVGVCALEPGDEDESEGERAETEITQIAVHRSRRGRGVGRRLVEAAAARADGPLTATFRAQVRPFYEATGFEVERIEGAGRFRGVRPLR